MAPGAYWKKASTSHLAHYADENRPIVVSYKVGQGEVIWWASSMPLSNTQVAQAGNLSLLLNSLGDASSTHVYWDEYFHSDQKTFGSYFKTPPILFGLAQGGLVVLALLLTYSRRNGPIYPVNEPSRLSPLEFVETLGGLYRQAKAVRVALEVPYARFRALATRQLGLKCDIASDDLARAIRNRLGYKDDSLHDLLQAIESALYDPELQETRALDLAQQLSFHTQRLQLISHPQ
jgi:pimeloyl-ACP methyl ester carboxylesterase